MSSGAVTTNAAVFIAAVTGGRRRFVAVLLLVAVLAICALSADRYATLKRELTDSALARRAAIGSLAATVLSDKFERLTDVGIALATRVRFQELVGAGRWSDAAQILRRVPEDFAFLDRLFIADVHGTLMADVPELPGVVGTNFAHRDWFKGVSRDWKPYVSDLYRRTAAPRRNVIAVSIPIRGAGAGIAGILVLQVRLEKFFDWVERIDPDPASRVLVVDGAWQAGFDSKNPAGDHSRDPAADPMVQRLAPGGAGARIVRAAHDSEDLVFDYAPASHRWGVATLQPASVTFAARDLLLRQIVLDGALIASLALAAIVLGAVVVLQRRREDAERVQRAERERAQAALAKQAERLRIVHEIDRAIIAEEKPEAIAEAVLQPLRELLGVPRAIVNMFDFAAGEVEWLAAAGRHRTRVGGVRYPLRLMGDIEALRRGEPQAINTSALPPGPEADALLASGVRFYMAVPMIAGGELIGALSFGGESDSFPSEQVAIAQEVATQLAIAIAQARLFERVRRHAEELELRVDERTAELKAVNRELESFSYSVSHDLRAPLRAVDGYALMLVEDYGARLDDEGRRLLGVVRESAAQMGRLIDDLLQFSQVGRKALTPAPVDMRSLAVEVVADLGQAYPKARIDLGALPAAKGDRALLRHVWMNLIGNALKYSARNESPQVEISGHVEGAESVYQVRDNGAGFDMRYHDKLFTVFQRLHREDEFEGTGVGLAIVQRVIVRHGGRVWGEGAPGQGACFRFALPKEV